jgi:hypothetical protein
MAFAAMSLTLRGTGYVGMNTPCVIYIPISHGGINGEAKTNIEARKKQNNKASKAKTKSTKHNEQKEVRCQKEHQRKIKL